jgi:predicted homoserine dehydrogenase-like protein
MSIKRKWRLKDIKEKHIISRKYPVGDLLDEDTLTKAIAEADQKVRKKKQLTKQMILTSLEDGRKVRFEGAIIINNEGEDKRMVRVQWQNGRMEAMFHCWKENGKWFGKRVGLL